MSSQPKQVFHLPQSPSESLLEVRGAFPGSQAALGRCYSARVFIVNAGSESAGRGTVAPTDAGAVCHQQERFVTSGVCSRCGHCVDTAPGPAPALGELLCWPSSRAAPIPGIRPSGPLTHSHPSPLTRMDKSSWGWFPAEGSSLPVTPVEGGPHPHRGRGLITEVRVILEAGGASVAAIHIVSPGEQSRSVPGAVGWLQGS